MSNVARLLARPAQVIVRLQRLLRARDRARESDIARRRSDEQFRRLMDTTHEGAWLVDHTGQTTYVNARLAALLGYAPEELRGRFLFEFLVPEHAFIARTLFASRQRGRSDQQEFAFIHRDGHLVWTLCASSPTFSDGGEFSGMLAMIGDLTQRRQAEQALADAHATLAALVSAAPMAIVVIDARAVVTTWNPEAERLFGWPRDEVLGHPLPTIPPELVGEFERMRAMEQGGEWLRGMETTRLHRDGTRLHVLISTAPLRDVHGVVEGTIGMLVDITEQRALQAQLLQAQKMEAVGQLAGGIAHDFNNLLTAIAGNATFLLDGCAHCGTVPPEAQEIQACADRAARLTSQLLAFSRRQMMRPQRLDLNDVVAGLESMLRRLVPENIRQDLELHESPTLVNADMGQLEQIVVNLVVNARDAMPDGGSVTLRVRATTLDQRQSARFGGARIVPGQYAELTVRDTGHGMDHATRGRAFEPFFTTKPVGQGTGLGLSTVYGIVKQNNGYVAIESTVGIGTTVSLYLPLATSLAIDSKRGESAPPTRTGHETILLVEDEAALARLSERVLSASGYSVLRAATAEEALTLARTHQREIHLLVTDIVLPNMSGAELAKRLLRQQPGLRVLFCSGYTRDQLGHRGILSLETDLLEKPFTPRDLCERVRRALDQRSIPVNSRAASA